jgi:hypothetical protein
MLLLVGICKGRELIKEEKKKRTKKGKKKGNKHINGS